MIELDIGVDFRTQALDQLFVAVLDGVEADIALDIHHEVLQRVEPVGVVGFGRDVGARHHLEKALGGRIVDLARRAPARRSCRPRDVHCRARRRLRNIPPVTSCRCSACGTPRSRRRSVAVFAAHARHVIEQNAIELHLLGIHRNRLQAKMLDQLAQRIRARSSSSRRFRRRRPRTSHGRNRICA